MPGCAGGFPPAPPDGYDERAAYEIDVICAKGFPSYFLIVADLINYARSVGIRVGPGRGSAAGSLVAYALGITDIDPIPHGLLFERFLNPERTSMPDIDIDFDDRRRGEMVRYAADKWGQDRVAQVITFGTIKTKAALKDSARIHYGQPGFAIADRITKALPPAIMAKDIPLSGITDPNHERYKEAAEVRGLIETDPDVRTIYQTARGLEGLIRNAGVHACAVIMSSEPLTEAIPLWKRPQDGAIITGWDYPSCEAIGLLKMDFLGLRNLTIIGDAIENIKANRGIDLDLESVPLDDPATYELLGRGETLGVFQLDGGPMRDLLRRMQPTGFEDIVAVLALYRPGPMGMNAHNDYADRKNNRQAIKPIHPELAEPLREILAETYGLIVYQEQIMRIAQKVASYSLARADILRKAMGKKKREVLEKEFEGFSEGMTGQRFLGGRDQGAVGHHPAVRRLRVQQVARRRLRPGLLLDRLPEGQLSRRVHGRPAHLGRRRQGQGRGLSRRLPQARHHGVAAGRQRVRSELRLGGCRHPLRAGCGAQRRRQRGGLVDRRPAATRANSPTSPTT